MALKTNYKDYQFQEGEKLRKYRQISNDDGTISFEDVTSYQQEGDRFSASDINATNTKVNELETTKATKEQVGNLNYKALSQSEYDGLPSKDENTIYFITEG